MFLGVLGVNLTSSISSSTSSWASCAPLRHPPRPLRARAVRSSSAVFSASADALLDLPTRLALHLRHSGMTALADLSSVSSASLRLPRCFQGALFGFRARSAASCARLARISTESRRRARRSPRRPPRSGPGRERPPQPTRPRPRPSRRASTSEQAPMRRWTASRADQFAFAPTTTSTPLRLRLTTHGLAFPWGRNRNSRQLAAALSSRSSPRAKPCAGALDCRSRQAPGT